MVRPECSPWDGQVRLDDGPLPVFGILKSPAVEDGHTKLVERCGDVRDEPEDKEEEGDEEESTLVHK